MTISFILPGVADPSMPLAIAVDTYGLVKRGLVAQYMFEETTGTAIADTLGGSNGVIDSLFSSNNAYAWLTTGDGGGLRLSGAQLASFPAYEQNAPWTTVTAFTMVGDFGGTGEKIVGVMGTRNMGIAAANRGAFSYSRGATDLDVAQTTGRYAQRAANGSGGQGTEELLLPTAINVSQVLRIMYRSFNGTNTITTRVYDVAGTLIASDDMTVNPAVIFLDDAVTLSNLQWSLGGLTSTFAAGITQYEFALRYAHAMTGWHPAEVAQVCKAASAISASRGRAL